MSNMFINKQTASLGHGLKRTRDLNVELTTCTTERGICLWNLQDLPQLRCHINIDDAQLSPTLRQDYTP